MTLFQIVDEINGKVNDAAAEGSAGYVLTRSINGGVSANVWMNDNRNIVAATKIQVNGRNYSVRTGTEGADGYLTIGATRMWLGTRPVHISLGTRKINTIYLGSNVVYERARQVVLFDNGFIPGYEWTKNAFTRPQYTTMAGASLAYVESDGYMKLWISDNNSSYTHNAHVCLTAPVQIPSTAEKLWLSARSKGTYHPAAAWGVLPSNAPNALDASAGGKLGTLSWTPTDYTTAWLNLESVRGQTLTPIINIRGVADASRVLYINRVWIE